MKSIHDIGSMTMDELHHELLTLRKKQFNLNLQKVNGTLTKNHLVKQLRKSIAQIKTMMTKKGRAC